MEMMVHTARLADDDSGGRALARVRSVRVVNILAWSYPAPASRLASELGLPDGERLYTTIAGSTPQWLLNRTCDDIASGAVDAVLIVGAETVDSGRQARAKGVPLERGERDTPVADEVIGDDRSAVSPQEMAARVVVPTTIYAMFESALAAQAGRTFSEQRRFVAGFMAPFTKVAASHADIAWFPVERTADEIATVGPDNRLICDPYPKLCNAVMQVDMSAAIIVMSAEDAAAAGVPRDRWVFPLAGAECNDVFVTGERPDFTSSPAIATIGRKAFEAAGVGIDDVASIDLYSCFPSAVQIGAKALGISLDDPRGLTVTGGLPYFGGPGNNYVTHSIAMTVESCRSDPGTLGLVTGNGWYVTKHSIGLYSGTPGDGWQHPSTAAEQTKIDADALEIAVVGADGVAVVDAMTIGHDRKHGAVAAPVYATLADGRRVCAVPAEDSVPSALDGRNLVGEKVTISMDGGRVLYEPA